MAMSDGSGGVPAQFDAVPGTDKRGVSRRSVLLGGAALGAYAGVLPVPIQRSAHTGGASPAPHSAPPSPAAPQVTGTAHLPKAKPRRVNVKGARGLCHAYAHQKAHGKQNSAVIRKLATAAGGAGNIPAFCASLGQPGASASAPPTPQPTITQPAPSASPPSSPPSQPGAHPAGKPSPHPTGQPSPTGQPTSVLA